MFDHPLKIISVKRINFKTGLRSDVAISRHLENGVNPGTEIPRSSLKQLREGLWLSLTITSFPYFSLLPPFSLIRDFRKQNTRGSVSKISVNHTCYRQMGSKPTNHSPLAWRKEALKFTLVAVIGGFRSDLSAITRKTDGNFGNVSAGVWFSNVAYQRKRW